MSFFGTLNLFCAICGKRFRYDGRMSEYWRSKFFGILCSSECGKASELKYARYILGKDDDSDI